MTWAGLSYGTRAVGKEVRPGVPCRTAIKVRHPRVRSSAILSSSDGRIDSSPGHRTAIVLPLSAKISSSRASWACQVVGRGGGG